MVSVTVTVEAGSVTVQVVVQVCPLPYSEGPPPAIVVDSKAAQENSAPKSDFISVSSPIKTGTCVLDNEGGSQQAALGQRVESRPGRESMENTKRNEAGSSKRETEKDLDKAQS